MSMLLRPRDLGMGQSWQQEVAALRAQADKLDAAAAAMGSTPAAAALRAQAAAVRKQAENFLPPVSAPTVIASSGIGIGHVLLGLGGLAAIGGVAWWAKR